MLILLPPSEGKATAGDGPKLDLSALSLAEVTEARETVLDALERVCSGPVDAAREVLGLSERQVDTVQRDLEVRIAPTLRAADLYTGVLYDHLRLPDLLASGAAARTQASVLIFSGLWGAVGVTDPLPPYRLSMGIKLPPLGALGTFWKSQLSGVLAARAEGRLIVDCRSAAYATAFVPTGEATESAVSVRVLRETTSGGVTKRSVVSHMAKATRGAIAHTLLAEGVDAHTPRELADALNDLGHVAELAAPARGKRPATLDIVVRA
ncbi:hypothetical protein CDO52_10305 [Nocardiopsis gilva YIM 90087]|uniref:Peroxide stress protein YaaA n=1 Tax=Nocardiopsis gilva YIM 90087 TaxID=1235441 RepID=A0A223S4R7_9ACTN|nr:peroxide stress protein YaaA [Nocardiopsis gilva]ASU83122.1 hypothetical protein CDO52_10305 [Nocardiopsis gilva YIM 90087]